MKLLIVHHIDIYRFGLASGLQKSSFKTDSIDTATSGEEAIIKCTEKHYDILIIGVDLPQMNGATTIRRVLKKSPNIKILAVSRQKQGADILSSYAAGALAYLTLDSDFIKMSNVLKQIANGKSYIDTKFVEQLFPHLNHSQNIDSEFYVPKLSFYELQVLQLISEGKSAQEIGSLTYRSKRTVDGYRIGMCKKFGVKNTVALVAIAVRKGLVVEKKEDSADDDSN